MKPIPLIALGLFAAMSPPAAQDPAIFRSESTLVVLHVNVYDKHDDPVTLLTRDNFAVTEDDRPQQITFFNGQDMPVAAGLVIDNSSSMIPRRKMVVAGGMTFANSSHPEDELFTVSFTEHVRFG